MSVQEWLNAAVGHLRSAADVKTVYGEPITVNGRTVIPVARVAYAFGGGMGHGDNGGEGGGFGGGAAAIPVGVIEVTAEGTKFIRYSPPKIVAVAGVMGLVVGFMAAKRRRRPCAHA